MREPHALLHGLFEAALAAVFPAACLPAHLPAPPAGRTVLIGTEKAAAMARVVEEQKPGVPRRARARKRVVAARDARQPAARAALGADFVPLILADGMEGKAREMALVHAAMGSSFAR